MKLLRRCSCGGYCAFVLGCLYSWTLVAATILVFLFLFVRMT
jgi:hypothetical protein